MFSGQVSLVLLGNILDLALDHLRRLGALDWDALGLGFLGLGQVQAEHAGFDV
jgi:hypothetical protein